MRPKRVSIITRTRGLPAVRSAGSEFDYFLPFYQMNKKLLIFLIDGLGDVNIPKLDSKTPLQQAHLPWLDKLAGTNNPFSFLTFDSSTF